MVCKSSIYLRNRLKSAPGKCATWKPIRSDRLAPRCRPPHCPPLARPRRPRPGATMVRKTDAYLLGLTIHRKGKLATLDHAVAALLASQTQKDNFLTLL